MSHILETSIDLQIGQRIRRARVEAAVTQHRLGEIIGLSSQQIHKYESGANRVSAGTLYVIAQTLGRSMEWFFRDLDDPAAPNAASWLN